MTGDAEQLPFQDASVDAYTIAFGIRNVTHIDAALDEAFRVSLCASPACKQNSILFALINLFPSKLRSEVLIGDCRCSRRVEHSTV